MATSALVIFWLVVAARLLVPLLIPRFPLFGILVCLVLDAADQSIFQALDIPLDGYQVYDKALDIYYLSIAYVSTMRNWENPMAFQVGRALFYLRLFGVLAFELSEQRLLLFLLPNVFEYFFIYYEIVRMRRDPLRLTRRMLIVAVTLLWFIVKLPHEWWVHVARLDATDFVKVRIFRAPPDEALWRAVLGAPRTTLLLAAIAASMGLALRRLLRAGNRGQMAEHLGAGRDVDGTATDGPNPEKRRTDGRRIDKPRADVTRGTAPRTGVARAGMARTGGRQDEVPPASRETAAAGVSAWSTAATMTEKTVLITILAVVFGQILPGLSASSFQIAICIALTIGVSTYVLRGLISLVRRRVSVWWELPIMALLNFSMVLVFEVLLPFVHAPYNIGATSLFAVLLTFFATMYDRYRVLYDARLRVAGETDEVQPAVEPLSESPADP